MFMLSKDEFDDMYYEPLFIGFKQIKYDSKTVEKFETKFDSVKLAKNFNFQKWEMTPRLWYKVITYTKDKKIIHKRIQVVDTNVGGLFILDGKLPRWLTDDKEYLLYLRDIKNKLNQRLIYIYHHVDEIIWKRTKR